MHRGSLCLVVALATVLIGGCDGSTRRLPAPVKAFPGAEGFGAYARGGRGGAVYQVTNLRDAGPGSLRACIEAAEPRTCVFRVAGTIELRSALEITDPFITIAGQTAPGDGITLRNGPGNPRTPIRIVDAHDVIIRHIRSRPGPSTVPSSNLDALEILGDAYDVIVDHVSLSWSVDEVLSTYPLESGTPRNVTVQWSIIAEGLDRSTHRDDAKHSKAVLLVSEAGGFTFHHNLMAHCRDRMPDVKIDGVADFVNNVMYNARSMFGEFYTLRGDVGVNYIGNFIRNGRSTVVSRAYGISLRPVYPAFTFEVYLEGNVGPHRPDGKGDDALIVEPEGRRFVVAEPLPAPTVTTTPADAALDAVLAGAGATRPVRDAVDRRIVESVRTGAGHIIDNPAEVGGWPHLRTGTPPRDRDRDGMADAWERDLGFDPADPGDRNGDPDGDGYTNLEDYLNQLAADVDA